LDVSKTVPRDITVAFYGLRYLVSTAPGSDSEWHVCPFPKDKNVGLSLSLVHLSSNRRRRVTQIPTYHPESVPPKALSREELPTLEQTENAPPLSKTVPIKTTKTASPKKGKAKARYVPSRSSPRCF
jgi:hypothetical protein